MEIKIVDVIKDLCRERDTSIPKIEKEIGLSNGSIYNWSRSYPSIDKVIKVADYFNVSIDILVGRELKEDAQNSIRMAARKSEGTLNENEIVLLKKLAHLLTSSQIDEIKDK